MIELSEYLLDLIFRQKSAVIPEIGSFQFVTKHAQILFGENTLLPPSQHLEFRESTHEGEGMKFVDFLINEKQFEPYEASIRIKAFTHQIKNTIRQHGYCYIPGLGTLHSREDGTLRFAPGDTIKALKPTLGLPTLTITPIAREFTRIAPTEDEVVAETFIDTRSEHVVSSRSRWVTPALLGFLFLGLGLIGYYIYQTNYAGIKDEDEETKVVLPKINEDSILLANHGFLDSSQVQGYQPDDTVPDQEGILEEIAQSPGQTTTVTSVPAPATTSPVSASKPAEPVVQKPVVVEKPATPDPVENTPTPDTPAKTAKCAIIVGAMGNKNNANKLVQRVEAAGFTPFTHYSKGLTKVGADCDCDQASVQRTLAAMKKISPGAWVYKK